VIVIVVLLVPSLIASRIWPDGSNLILLGPLAGSGLALLVTSAWLRKEERLVLHDAVLVTSDVFPLDRLKADLVFVESDLEKNARESL
jgi:hypothetical protein